jgi:hypothetical protein
MWADVHRGPGAWWPPRAPTAHPVLLQPHPRGVLGGILVLAPGTHPAAWRVHPVHPLLPLREPWTMQRAHFPTSAGRHGVHARRWWGRPHSKVMKVERWPEGRALWQSCATARAVAPCRLCGCMGTSVCGSLAHATGLLCPPPPPPPQPVLDPGGLAQPAVMAGCGAGGVPAPGLRRAVCPAGAGGGPVRHVHPVPRGPEQLGHPHPEAPPVSPVWPACAVRCGVQPRPPSTHTRTHTWTPLPLPLALGVLLCSCVFMGTLCFHLR